jgi:spore coat polysaccharide biosynthesis protein SpsF
MVSVIVQARMGSSRLPGKTLAIVAGKPMLAHVIERLKGARLLQGIVVATTTKKADDAIAKLAEKLGVYVFRGSEGDVLDRYYQAFRKYPADVIVRVSSDCALTDPHVVDKVVSHYLKGNYDYVSNILKRTYPDGLDVEVFSFKALEKAWQEAKWASEREHVTPYIHRNPNKFRLANVENEVDLSHLRWTVDWKEDLEFVRQVYKHLYKEGQIFYMEDVLELLKKHPDLKKINQGIATNEGYAKSLKEDKIVK